MIDFFLEETGARYGCHANILNHPLAEFQICPTLELRKVKKFLNIYKNKISSLRDIVL